jgi:hypothetical protein
MKVSVLIALLAALTGPPAAFGLSPARTRWLECTQVITFDGDTVNMRGEWKRQLDNLVEFRDFDSGVEFEAFFYLATDKELSSPLRLRQRAKLENAISRSGLPIKSVALTRPDPKSLIGHAPRGYSLPYAVVSARHTFSHGDLRDAPKCW